jgi:adenylate cyclase
LRGQILISENTYKLARDFITTGSVNEVRTKGIKGLMRMYELRSTNRPKNLFAPAREMRNSPRVDVNLPLTFQLLKGKRVIRDVYSGHATNISYGGICIVSNVPIESHSNVKISLSVSSLTPDITDIYAKVLRVTTAKNKCEFTIEFTHIDKKSFLVIKEFIDRLVELKWASRAN